MNQLIGQPVVNELDRNVGRLKTLVLNRSSGSIRYGVVSENSGSYVVPRNLMKETSTGQVKIDESEIHLRSDFSAFEPGSVSSNFAPAAGLRNAPFSTTRLYSSTTTSIEAQ